jgi:hypothetical protein
MVIALSSIITTVSADTLPVKVKVEDGSGASVKGELVIIQDLYNREHEVFRVLSEEDGSIPPFQLQPGLYRVIATAPYGLWQTNVHEFLVGQKSTEVIIKVQPLPTHGYGDIVIVPIIRRHLRVIGPDGLPASGVSILVRDRDATLYLERWYKTDKKGTTSIELVSDHTVVVVIYGDVLLTTELTQHVMNPVIRLQSR